ncbi:phospholipase ABHD3 [Sphaerodactylus townsendi]|uniref:phospholipase ABHD3 n=1 Tax=Sphaerodactylus townsendi TaxID=933632 RepID=UPI002025CE16|nr:phospholipase ABHD3 [Sphaerodactylus townsendi]
MNLQGLTQELSLYLESQVPQGLWASGVGWSLLLCFGVAYACYYLSSIAKKPELVTGSKSFHHFLQVYCPVVKETYYPPVWCWESRVQTLLRPLITSRPYVPYRNELIKATDGGQISLDWFDNNDSVSCPDASTRPTILLLPGLTGSSRESYILHMIQQSKELGYRCVVFNYRGIAGENLLTPRTYCASNTEDLEAVIHYICSLYSSAPLMAAGVSMGGMLLVNYLGKTGTETPLKAAAVFSAGWNVFDSVDSLEKPVNWLLFNYYLTSCLRSSVIRHREIFQCCFNMNPHMVAKTIREFDKQFTSVMFGYPTIDDYYTDASPFRRLKNVGIPVLCLNSMDDVFSPNHAIPVEMAKQNPNVALVLTSCGGHIAFLEGFWPRKCTYMDRVFKQFVQAVFEHGSKILNM